MDSMPAVQQQVRTHARVGRGRRRSASGLALPPVAGSVGCTDCGDAVPRSEVMYAGHGTLCAPCHSAIEGDGVDGVGIRVWETLVAVVRALGMTALALLLLWLMVTNWSGQPVGVNQFVAWFTVLSPLWVLGGALTLQGLRHTRTRWVLRDAHGGATTAVAVHAGSTLVTGLATLALVGLGILPLVG